MTTQEIQEMIAKSEQRVQQLQERGIYDAKMENYHAGYQDALRTVLSCLRIEETFDELATEA